MVSVDKGYIGFTVRMADTETYRKQKEVSDKVKIAGLEAKEQALSEGKKSMAALLQTLADDEVATATAMGALEKTLSAIPGIDAEMIMDRLNAELVQMRDKA